MEKKNVFMKLQESRVKLQESNLKKSGKNSYAGFEYFELADIVPTLNKICEELKLTFIIDFEADKATLTLINCEEPTEIYTISCPYAEANLKGCQPIQNLGGQQTYIRRYLIMNMFNVTEPDLLDNSVGKKEDKIEKGNKGKKSTTTTEEEPVNPNLITQKQKNMLFAISKDKTEKVKDIIGKYGYTSSSEIQKKDFNNICDEIRNLG